MAQDVTTIVFDIGNVLFRYEPNFIVSVLCPDTENHDYYHSELIHHQRWQEMDRGDLSLSTLKDVLHQETDLTEQRWEGVQRIVTQFVHHLVPITQTIHAFQCWYKPIYLLTNFQADPFDQLWEKYPFLSISKGQIVSAKVGFNKPETAIYQQLLTTYDLDPQTCLFIDDLQANIDAAIANGMQGICYQNPLQLKEKVMALGLEWPE